jgi:hypothetical protein
MTAIAAVQLFLVAMQRTVPDPIQTVELLDERPFDGGKAEPVPGS